MKTTKARNYNFKVGKKTFNCIREVQVYLDASYYHVLVGIAKREKGYFEYEGKKVFFQKIMHEIKEKVIEPPKTTYQKGLKEPQEEKYTRWNNQVLYTCDGELKMTYSLQSFRQQMPTEILL